MSVNPQALPAPARIGIGGPVGSGKTALIEKISTRFNQGAANPDHSMWSVRTQPQMPMFHQKSNPMLFGLNRKGFRKLNNLEIGDI